MTTWPALPLSELVDFHRGLTYQKSDEVEYSANAVLRANNIDKNSGKLNLDEIRYINPKIKIAKGKMTKAGSLLICTASGSKTHLGKVALIEDDEPYAFGGFMGLLVPKEGVSAKYLFYLTRARRYNDFISSLSDGANINNLKFNDLGQLPVPFPPLKVQERIVAALDGAFSALNLARDNAETNLSAAEELFTSWLTLVFEREREAWPSKKLPEICENLDRQRVPITKSDRRTGEVPYYGASGEVDRVADFIFDENLLLVSEDGANLLARTYPIAFSITGKSWVNNHAHVLRFDNLVDQEFVRLYLDAIPLDPFVSGMAQPKLNQKALNSIPIPFPDQEQRARVVAKAKEVATASDRAWYNYEAQLEDVEDLRLSILEKAFAGELA